ncbi:GMC oxidoreductase [Microbulbifer rhizosphaerae]|uniref:Choline dehydrogenase-like flavoprotein n=1 Tax=Microbulbifer rhizosphaerae TaxID=1562603 RepID=A0A7W4WE02_9GAMM|nr:GMC family oxidoreductase [Microbulbifer rhizosphaerae]MBB3061928.1 choline dehydrogenase-like flavoprotein [Microbulbifer rhizosphaerae]
MPATSPLKSEYDVIVVGAGAAGAAYISRLTAAGLNVLAIERGPFYRDHYNDFYESELAVFNLLWDNNNYGVSGKAFRGTPNLGRAVGGGTLAWTAVALRFFERDFTFASRWGRIPGSNVADWPIRLHHLRRYYSEAEIHMGVSGAPTVWDAPGTPPPPNPPLPLYRGSRLCRDAFERLNMNWAPGRIAVNSQPYNGNGACLNCGHCRAGCRINAKYQADKVLIEPALATGYLTLAYESVVTRLRTSECGRRVCGVTFADTVSGEYRDVDARFVVVCNNPIETPRLLLASANDAHPGGLGNRYDQVGRNFFCHLGTIGYGITEQDLRNSIGHNMGNIMSLDTCENTDNGDYAGGFTLMSLQGAGAGVVALDPLVAVNGERLKEKMAAYNNSILMVSFVEGLPVADNRITLLLAQCDEFGVPKAHVHYDYHDNDIRALGHAQARMRQVLQAAGSSETFVSPEFESHPMGSMRMGRDPHVSATDPWGRVHGIPNLYIGGASLFASGSSVNPTLTLHALALRSADHLVRASLCSEPFTEAVA